MVFSPYLLSQCLLVKSGFSTTIKLSSGQVHIRPRSSDLTCFKQIFIDREYDFKLPECSTVVDLGANSGLFTIWIKNVFPECSVIALEPEASNFKALVNNTSHLTGVKPLNLAIWSSSSNLQIVVKDGGEWAASISQLKSDNISMISSGSTVRSISMPQLILQENITSIDLLKIDIEGSESELFANNCEWLRLAKVICIELHDHMSKGCSKRFLESLSVLDDYSICWKGENLIVYNNSHFHCSK
jgi:FkbM family methyltransferase